jgi:hypothetical protein
VQIRSNFVVRFVGEDPDEESIGQRECLLGMARPPILASPRLVLTRWGPWPGRRLEHLAALPNNGRIHRRELGEDVPGSWMTADEVSAYLAQYGLSWKDLHAAR